MLVYLYHALVFGKSHYGLLIIVPIPEYTITEVSELSQTERGDGGFGSTGTGHENESSAATGTQSQLKEQVESVPEPAAAQEGAEVSEG